MSKLKLGVIVGSNRKDSINRLLAQALVKLGAEAFEGTLIQIDDLPMYNQDLENNPQASVTRFKAAVEASDALLFVTPEYLRSIPAVLKNALDNGSRPWGKSSWGGDKPAAIIGTSGGAISTAAVQQHLRAVLGDIGLNVIGGEAYIQFKPDLINATHDVTDDTVKGFLKAFIDKFAGFAGKLAAK